MDYASFLYNDSAQSHVRKLDWIQNQAMRITGGFIKSTPIHVMERELSLQPLVFRREYLGHKFYLKSKSCKINSIVTLLNDLSELMESFRWNRKKKPLLVCIHNNLRNTTINISLQFEMFSLNIWISGINLQNFIKSNIKGIHYPKRTFSHLQLNSLYRKMCSETYDGFYKVFTDGSKDSFGGGAAFYDSQINFKAKFQINHALSIMHI